MASAHYRSHLREKHGCPYENRQSPTCSPRLSLLLLALLVTVVECKLLFPSLPAGYLIFISRSIPAQLRIPGSTCSGQYRSGWLTFGSPLYPCGPDYAFARLSPAPYTNKDLLSRLLMLAPNPSPLRPSHSHHLGAAVEQMHPPGARKNRSY